MKKIVLILMLLVNVSFSELYHPNGNIRYKKTERPQGNINEWFYSNGLPESTYINNGNSVTVLAYTKGSLYAIIEVNNKHELEVTQNITCMNNAYNIKVKTSWAVIGNPTAMKICK